MSDPDESRRTSATTVTPAAEAPEKESSRKGESSGDAPRPTRPTRPGASAAGDRTALDVAREAAGMPPRAKEGTASGDSAGTGEGGSGREAGSDEGSGGETASDDGDGASVARREAGTLRISDEEMDAPLEIGGHTFRSRLIVGTGKYADGEIMMEAIRASGAEMVTVAVRRIDLDQEREEGILHQLDPDDFFLLANTAGCYTAEEAVRYARLARAAGFNEFLKLEVIGDEETLLPDVQETVEAARILTEEGFKVMAYTNDDLVTALRLEDAGCVAVMPLASPIGSGLGVVNPYFIREIKRRLDVPVIVDAGVGTASDACVTMEQGVDGILMNTALAAAEAPVAMARAMRYAVRAGRYAWLAGRMPTREIAVPSSPREGMLD